MTAKNCEKKLFCKQFLNLPLVLKEKSDTYWRSSLTYHLLEIIWMTAPCTDHILQSTSHSPGSTLQTVHNLKNSNLLLQAQNDMRAVNIKRLVWLLDDGKHHFTHKLLRIAHTSLKNK